MKNVWFRSAVAARPLCAAIAVSAAVATAGARPALDLEARSLRGSSANHETAKIAPCPKDLFCNAGMYIDWCCGGGGPTDNCVIKEDSEHQNCGSWDNCHTYYGGTYTRGHTTPCTD